MNELNSSPSTASEVGELPPLPLGIGAGHFIHVDAVRAYGQECARAALAAKTVACEVSDSEIERLALKHIATGWKQLAAVTGNPDDYKQTEQFKRLKAYTLDLLAARRTQAEGSKTKTISDNELLAWMRPHLDNADGGYLCDMEPKAAIAAGRAAIAATQSTEQRKGEGDD